MPRPDINPRTRRAAAALKLPALRTRLTRFAGGPPDPGPGDSARNTDADDPAADNDGPARSVNPQGGDAGAGSITGLSVITRGEALGHRLWIDRYFLTQVAEAIRLSGDRGIKSRFTHPGASSDGLGTLLGRVKGGEVDGDQVRADLHCAETAHATPDGDLAGYVLRLAAEDDSSFGTSIVFDRDFPAEDEFLDAHRQVLTDKDGRQTQGEFASPDPDNVHNFRHARLLKLCAVDFVDDPAANPDGLFHRQAKTGTIPLDAETLCAYALGLTDQTPGPTAFDIDPDRLRAFAGRFLAAHGLTITATDPAPDPAPEPETAMPKTRLGKKPTAKPAKNAKKLAAKAKPAAKPAAKKFKKAAKESGDGEDDELERDDPLGDDEEDDDPTDSKPKGVVPNGEGDPGTPAMDDGDAEEDAEEDVKDATEGEPELDVDDGDDDEADHEADEDEDDEDEDDEEQEPLSRKEGKRFIAAFGRQGAVWFAQGQSFAEAQALHSQAQAKEIKRLKSEVADLNKRLNRKLRGEADPVSRSPDPAEAADRKKAAKDPNKLSQKLGSEALARFAAGLKLPGAK